MTRSQQNARGAALMMASMLCFTVNDTFIKLMAGVLPLAQVLTLRGALTSILIAALMYALGQFRFAIPRHDRTWVALRVFAELGAAYFFLTALFNMPLPNVTAILQALPLAVTLAAALFLGEPVGWRRLVAIGVGFCGVMLIIRPGADDFTVYSLYALAAVAFVTLRDLATRRLSADTPSLAVSFYSSLGVMLFFALRVPLEGWEPVSRDMTIYIALAAFFIIGGYIFSIMVMRVGEVGFVANFRYTSLIWALLLGWLVFGDWPVPMTLLGAAIVICSGLFLLLRERRLNRRDEQ